MIPNRSPWLVQLQRQRPVVMLAKDLTTDVVIVGGGIAGVMTAYFLLRDTASRVVLLEAEKIAHGATGHNAGQITSYFERSFSDLVQEFGLEMASRGQRDVESAWLLIDEIFAHAKLATPLHRFTGHAGCVTIDQLLGHLENNRLRLAGGLPAETIVVADHPDLLAQIPDQYKELYEVADHADVIALLETRDPRYIAVVSYQKGCMNSALFSEELAGYLLATYADRFAIHEESPVREVRLQQEQVVCVMDVHHVTAQKVVLCTNGFEQIKLVNLAGPEIDTAFHHLVEGRIGYMSGYLEPLRRPPVAISYFPGDEKKNGDPTGEPYFYLTRRPFEHEGRGAENLVCVGGPDRALPNRAVYHRGETCPEEIWMNMEDFLYTQYAFDGEKEPLPAFCWHGLMGYTPNGIRRIGPEPRAPRLLYNLGCNGVGILPSIFGGKRIAAYCKGEEMEPSIFDPKDSASL